MIDLSDSFEIFFLHSNPTNFEVTYSQSTLENCMKL